jgi:hypothetical protein
MDDFQADLAVLFRTRLANPDDAARHSTRSPFVRNEFDRLSSFQTGRAADAKPIVGTVEDEAGNALRLAAIVNDEAGAFFHGYARQVTAFRNASVRHLLVSLWQG